MEIKDAILAGQPLPCTVVDMHCHLTGHYYRGWYQWRPSTDEVIRNMIRYGVDWTVTAPHPFVGGYHDLANRIAREAARRYPARIKGYITVNPCWTLERAKREVAEYIDDEAFVGFKLLPEYQGPILSPVHEYALETAGQRGMPTLIHTWKDLPTRR